MDINTITSTIDQIATYLASKLQVPMEKALDILHKEYVYHLYINGLWGVITLAMLIVGIVLVLKDKKNEWYVVEESEGLILVLWGVLLVLGGGFFFCNLNDFVHGLISPEIYTFEKVIRPMLGK